MIRAIERLLAFINTETAVMLVMPWKELKECSVMDERLQFVASRRAGSGTLQGVWHLPQTGYEIFDRYQECGMQGLTDKPTSVSLRQPTSVPGRKLHTILSPWFLRIHSSISFRTRIAILPQRSASPCHTNP